MNHSRHADFCGCTWDLRERTVTLAKGIFSPEHPASGVSSATASAFVKVPDVGKANSSNERFHGKRPKILSPAGSPEALYAALDAGADEIYFGLWAHNARAGAKNFTEEEARQAIRKCRLLGVKTNITLNTLVTDRELPGVLNLAETALEMGADAFIVQDLGLARALKKAFPEICLHASTQCACHSTEGAKYLIDAGFERVVLAREMDMQSIKNVVSLGVETEIFVHGALCVCHSGMCLMSSVIGKRSGNRGLCAQPCRLPYTFADSEYGAGHRNEKNACRYPLSLKDLSLCRHIKELSELSVTSLKIEGRMKAPEYVANVTKVWKTLVSENRNATNDEYKFLESLFSRSGFTDGYFTGAYRKDNKDMYGVRTDNDKRKTKELDNSFPLQKRKREVFITCDVAPDKKPVLTIGCSDNPNIKVSCQADFVPKVADTCPVTENDLKTSLSKLGDTDFLCTGIQVNLTGSLFIAKSEINRLRREAVQALEERILEKSSSAQISHAYKAEPTAVSIPIGNSESRNDLQMPKIRFYPMDFAGLEKMRVRYAEFGNYSEESVCFPLGLFADDRDFDKNKNRLEKAAGEGKVFGVRMPRVMFDSEYEYAAKALERAESAGISYAVAENVGQIELIRRAGLQIYGGAGLNIFNSGSLAHFAENGLSSVTLSPELLTAQMRDIVRQNGVTTAVICAGRLELMVLESCIIKCASGCKNSPDGAVCSSICDRTGAIFPIRAQRRISSTPFPCRNIILNSVPLRLIEKTPELLKTRADVYCVYD